MKKKKRLKIGERFTKDQIIVGRWAQDGEFFILNKLSNLSSFSDHVPGGTFTFENDTLELRMRILAQDSEATYYFDPTLLFEGDQVYWQKVDEEEFPLSSVVDEFSLVINNINDELNK